MNEDCCDVKMIKSLNDNILPKQSILETCKIMKVSILPTRARHRDRIKKRKKVIETNKQTKWREREIKKGNDHQKLR